MITGVEDYVTKCKKCGKTITMRYSKNKNKWYPTEYGGGPADFHQCVINNTEKEVKKSNNKQNKICPILAMNPNGTIYCQKDNCAWWVCTENRCVMKALLIKH